MLDLRKMLAPWTKAASLNSYVPLYCFPWKDSSTFLTKRGDLGRLFRVGTLAYEGVDVGERNAIVQQFESAIRAFPAGSHLYQYLFKRNCPNIPFATYENPLVQATQERRRAFFHERREQMYEIDVYCAAMIEGQRSRKGPLVNLSQSGTVRLLSSDLERDRARLEARVDHATGLMRDKSLMTPETEDGTLRFFRRLLNFDDWRIDGRVKHDQPLDFQVTNSTIRAEEDYLQIGDHYVAVLTLKDCVSTTYPLLMQRLLEIKANFYVCTEWAPMTEDEARKHINSGRNFANASKETSSAYLNRGAQRLSEKDRLIDESKQADIERLGEAQRTLGVGTRMGWFSLTIVVYDRDRRTLRDAIPEFARVFTAADGTLYPESDYRDFSLFACIPGNYDMAIRRRQIFDTNYADLSFLFAVQSGEQWNAHLGAEYLAVLESTHGTPVYFNLHDGDLANELILGRPGSGKTFLCCTQIAAAQKYSPQTYIFDVKGSFRSLTRIYDGAYLEVGAETSGIKINPLLHPKRDAAFITGFLQMLMEGSKGDPLTQKQKDHLFERVNQMEVYAPELRTLSTLAAILPEEMRDRLDSWIAGGQYGYLFDHAEDTLILNDFQTCDFGLIGNPKDMMEPLLYLYLHRMQVNITSPAAVGRFKLVVLDEAWVFVEHPILREFIRRLLKLGRSVNCAVVLSTQSLQELLDSGIWKVIAESVPTRTFLANPGMDPDAYRQAFKLNDATLELIAGCRPKRDMVVTRLGPPASANKLILNADPLTYWISTNNAKDDVLKRRYCDEHGQVEGLRRLAEEFPVGA